MIRIGLRLGLGLALLLASASTVAQSCAGNATQLQLLGGGGADLADARAAPATLLWNAGKARLLIDAGPGAALRFAQSGANFADLEALLLTQLRAERSADLPALLQLSPKSARTRTLPIYGPAGNRWMPSTVAFVRSLFDPTRGSWRHLGDVLSPLVRTGYKLAPHDVRSRPAKLGVARGPANETIAVLSRETLRVTALPLLDDQTPTLAWRIESGGKHVVIAANSVLPESLRRFADGADVLVLPHNIAATAEQARLADGAKVKQLILNARSRATLGKEAETLGLIRRQYAGPVAFANDLDCVSP